MRAEFNGEVKNAEKIRQACDLLFSPGHVVELRALGDRTHYGYYTDHVKLVRNAEFLGSLPDTRGIYVTLNEVNRHYLQDVSTG